MPRKKRSWIDGGIYHLTARGNNRQTIFRDSQDYQQYLLELSRCCKAQPYRLLAYALMPNHVHLIMQAVKGSSLSDVMHLLATRYTRYFNGKYMYTGHLYQGRFWSNEIDRESYLLEVTRYVHLNPYRAHLVSKPELYPWSSYGYYIGVMANPLRLIEADTVLALFGVGRQGKIRYRKFVEAEMDNEGKLYRWVYQLHKQRLIPPARWLRHVPGALYYPLMPTQSKVPGTLR